MSVFICPICWGSGCHSCNGKGKIEIDNSIYNCPSCHGRGHFVFGDIVYLPGCRIKCGRCNGTGKIDS